MVKRGKTSGVFSQRLKEWRGARSRAELDAALHEAHGLSDGYTALLENNRIKPPSQAVCQTIASALGVDPKTVWDVAVQDRLAAFDPELASWFGEQQARPVGDGGLSKEEKGLVNFIRDLSTRWMLSPNTTAYRLQNFLRGVDQATPEAFVPYNLHENQWNKVPLALLLMDMDQVYYLGRRGFHEEQRSILATLHAAAMASMDRTDVYGPFSDEPLPDHDNDDEDSDDES